MSFHTNILEMTNVTHCLEIVGFVNFWCIVS